MGSTINLLQDGTDGSIGTGTLQPLQTCAWVLQHKDAHAIVLNVVALDLDHAVLCRAGRVEIYDGTAETGVLLGRGCSLEAGESSWDNGQFTAFSGTMTIHLRYEAPCANHDGFRATYSIAAKSELKCAATCPNALPCLDVCHNHGQCVHGSCACQDGYHGLNCKFKCAPMAPCDKLSSRKAGVAISGLGFPAPRRDHSAVVVSLGTTEVELQRWTDTATTNMDSIATSVAQCPTLLTANATTHHVPLELVDAGIVQALSVTETAFTFQGVANRIITRITSKAKVGGYRRSIFFGGELRRGAGVSNEVWTLDVQTPALPSSLPPACELTSMHDSLDLLFSAGKCTVTTKRCNTFSESSPYFPRVPLYNQWTKWETPVTRKSPLARAGHTAIIMRQANAMVVFGGRGSNGAVLDDVWGLSLSEISASPIQGQTQTIQWQHFSPKGQASDIKATRFDGEFAGSVEHEDNVRLIKDDRVKLTLTADNRDTIVISRAHVFEVSSETGKFRFISSKANNNVPTEGYQGTLEIFPRPRADHAASSIVLDQGEAMVVYGGVGAGPKILNDVWLLFFETDSVGNNVQQQWKQIQKSHGNFLAASYGEGLFNFVKPNPLQRYGAGMVSVVSSINMNDKGIDEQKSYIKETLLVMGGVNEKKVPDGLNIDYNTMWHSQQYFNGGRNPLLFYVCPESDV